MNLDTLQKIAEAAEQHTRALTMTGPRCPWYDAPSLVAKLECSDADAEFIAAASPELMLSLIAIARAAKASLQASDEFASMFGLASTTEVLTGDLDGDFGNYEKTEAALRAALSALPTGD